ncbi:MAG TPA: redox-regulated ATPase YchF, partial [Thermodesulforhabdus norvegica]|nr:redox-regulated ATPase YchF [Thermodesulforhabdus norvegica]
MKLGIVGLPRSGKTTLFRALTGIQDAGTESGGKLTPVQGVVSVPDERLDWLFEQFKSKKKTPVQVTYLDLQGFSENRKKYLSSLLNHMR